MFAGWRDVTPPHACGYGGFDAGGLERRGTRRQDARNRVCAAGSQRAGSPARRRGRRGAAARGRARGARATAASGRAAAARRRAAARAVRGGVREPLAAAVDARRLPPRHLIQRPLHRQRLRPRDGPAIVPRRAPSHPRPRPRVGRLQVEPAPAGDGEAAPRSKVLEGLPPGSATPPCARPLPRRPMAMPPVASPRRSPRCRARGPTRRGGRRRSPPRRLPPPPPPAAHVVPTAPTLHGEWDVGKRATARPRCAAARARQRRAEVASAAS